MVTSSIDLIVSGNNVGFIFTARRNYASAVLGVVILSVRLSIRLSVRLSNIQLSIIQVERKSERNLRQTMVRNTLTAASSHKHS